MSLTAAVRDLREVCSAAGAGEVAEFETDVLAGFVLARAAAGLSDGTISSDVLHVEQVRAWFSRPLWEMEPPDADAVPVTWLRDRDCSGTGCRHRKPQSPSAPVERPLCRGRRVTVTALDGDTARTAQHIVRSASRV